MYRQQLMKRVFKRYTLLLVLMLHGALYTDSAYSAIQIDPVAFNRSIAAQDAAEYLESLYQTKLDNGVRNFIPLSLMLITTSKQMLADGNHVTALACAEYASRFSPDFPAATIHKSYVNWHANRFMFHHLLIGYAHSFVQKFYTLDELSLYVFTQLAVLGSALMLTLAGIALMSLVRNCRLLIHDIGHFLPAVLSSQTAVALLVLLCVFPLFWGFSFVWLFPYWLMLFWCYHNVKERAFIGILIVMFVFVVPLIAVTCSYALFMPQSDVVSRLWQANYGYYTKVDIENFEQDVIEKSDDYELLFSSGLINKREQNYTTALSYYNRLLKKNPLDYRVCINTGNVYFAIGDWEKAVELYSSAIAAAPDKSAAAYFNLARAYQQKFMFKEAERCLLDAKRLDSDRVETYLEIYSENNNRLLIDETISRKDLWLKGLNEFLVQSNLLNSIWDLFFAGLRLPFGTSAVLALLLFNLIFSDKNFLRIAAKCTLCGKIMCQRCQRNIAADILCLQCQNFLKKQDQLSYKQKDSMKTKIHGYIRSFRRWIVLFSIFIPGMAHVLKGRFIQGTFFSFLFSWFLCQSIFSYFFRGPWSDIEYSRIVFAFIFLILAVILWFVLRAHIRTVRSTEIEDNVVLMSLGIDS
jgi:tetratricopeptide (TPR) repeat protein